MADAKWIDAEGAAEIPQTYDVPERIYDMLAKLHILKNNAGTPGEAAAAAAMYQKQLFKWTIDETEVMRRVSGMHGTAGIGFTVGETHVSYLTETGEYGLAWQNLLLASVATNTFCKCIMSHDGKYGHLIGSPTHRLVASEMFMYLRNEIMRLCDIREVQFQKLVGSKLRKSERYEFRQSYCMGATETVRNALALQRIRDRKTVENNQSAKNALAVIDGGITEYVKNNFSLSSVKYKRGNAKAYAAGQRDGKNISLARQVGYDMKKLGA